MKRTMFFSVFSFAMAVFFFGVQPVYAYVSIPKTFNEFMEMTSSGSQKVATASSKVGLGMFVGRVILGMTVVGGVLSIGLSVWDSVRRLRDGVKANVSLPPSGSLSPVTTSENKVGWGITTSYYTLISVRDTCTGTVTIRNWDYQSNNRVVVGQSIEKRVLRGYLSCNQGGTTVVRDANLIEYYTYYINVFPSQYTGSYSPQPQSTPIDPSTETNTKLAVAVMREALGRMTEFQERVATFLDPRYDNHLVSADSTKQMLQGAEEVLRNGVPVQEKTDYIVVDEEKAVPVPEGQGPGEGVQPQPQPETEAPPITDGVCEPYSRMRNFRQIWDSISSQARSVGMLSLLNKLVINPTGGAAPDKISFSVSQFGAVNFDLNTYHYRDIIMAFRFFVLAGAFIAAYYIIFS